MKRLFLILTVALLGWQGASAQNSSKNGLLSHLAVGASLGTDGLGFDVATPLSNSFAVRAGVSFFPNLKFNGTIDINDNNPAITDEVDIQATLNTFDMKVLADYYPFKHVSFHITAGAFFGNGEMLKATNTSMFIKDPAKYGKLGLMIGDYRITTDDKGYIEAEAKVNKLKPYIGIGFGRTVPKARFSVTCDFGVQLWGKAGLYAWPTNDWGDKSYHKFTYKDLDDQDDKDLRDAFDLADKVSLFPILNIRISGRIF